jgi:hypothetical protein
MVNMNQTYLYCRWALKSRRRTESPENQTKIKSIDDFLIHIKKGKVKPGSILIFGDLPHQNPRLLQRHIEEIVDRGLTVKIPSINITLTKGFENDPLKVIPLDTELWRSHREYTARVEQSKATWAKRKARQV